MNEAEDNSNPQVEPDAEWSILIASWLLAAGGTLGSLYFSEVMEPPPSSFYWMQRVFMFPLAIILLIGLFPFDARVRSRNSRGIVYLLGALVFCVSCATDGAPSKDSGYEPSRTAWGTPDIGGVWDFGVLTPLERPAELADKAVMTPVEARAFRDGKLEELYVDAYSDESQLGLNSYDTFWYDWGTQLDEELRTSLIVDPADGRLPELTSAARAQSEEQLRTQTPPVRDRIVEGNDNPPGPEWMGTSDRCLAGFNAGPPLMSASYNNILRIVQAPGYVVLVTEMIHEARIIPMDGRPHLPSELRRWQGDSRARWEGDSLVIDTINFTDKKSTFLIPSGPLVTKATQEARPNAPRGHVGSAKNLHLTERLTPVAEGRLRYEYTIDDALTFVRPFTVQFTMRSADGPMFEYACHEGNYALPNTLKGARFLESQTD
jgi:hypothetical protein